MLEVVDLKKSFSENQVLKGINLTIDKGETVVIVGQSGGGKTTLLRCINDLEVADSGIIKIEDDLLFNNRKKLDKKTLKRVRKNIGFVFQNYNLFPHMSVIENLIEAPQKVRGKSREEALLKAREILKFLGLSSKENSYPFELSGGQKQRVAIGRALALEPKLLCFDEPTSALDPELTMEMANLIKGLEKKGISNLIITHDMNFAKSVATKIYSMNGGKLEEGLIFES
ncbi:amino acid ABC transporter ATP-binding protein, PAAT family [Clostridium sp. DSM 8431]|uniref:amino acid ABC transporter ATP-binding protein n=1 Tax=Clostridium sp. DSM 8431 TaxID=1761781 RepID=UPI0008EDC99F|nr:amino acid ABC transporter ATP-binding protein [Clostridium sp. DSM 8431]SFU82164.1 amino acid ABC transporter ATP-binding protein, PAAT family [Clostridium sp. DSM 8431]